MIEELKPKTQQVSKEQVWSAWKQVKKGGKGMGIDQVSTREIEANPRKYLYPLWNRLASGSYYPPPVREVPIPKGGDKVRMLGIPKLLSYYFITVSCRNVFARTNIRLDFIF